MTRPLTREDLDKYAGLVLATQLATEQGREATHRAIDEYQAFTETLGGDFEAFVAVIEMARRALTLESELAQLWRELERSKLSAVAADGTCCGCGASVSVAVPHCESDCIDKLRREKAEREELERRLVDWLRDDSVDECRSVERQSLPDGVETVSLSWETPDEELAERTGHPSASVGSFVQADGPTYEAALAAALGKLEKT